jgi:hypothetical protein
MTVEEKIVQKEKDAERYRNNRAKITEEELLENVRRTKKKAQEENLRGNNEQQSNGSSIDLM